MKKPTMEMHYLEDPVKIKKDNRIIAICSGAVFVLLVAAIIINTDGMSKVLAACQSWTYVHFGGAWQILLFANICFALFVCCSRYGSLRMGGIDKPELSLFRYIAILYCTAIAAGGVFWGAAEPFSHLLTVPPLYAQQGVEPMTTEAAVRGVQYGSFNSGMIVWTLYFVFSLPLLSGHYRHGLPMRPSTAFYPILGINGCGGIIGKTVDVVSVVAVAAGTIGPVGFLSLQLSSALQTLFGIPDVLATQFTILGLMVIVYTLCAISGLFRGIQILSKLNAIFALVLLGGMLFLGNTGFLVDTFIRNIGGQFTEFVSMCLWREPMNDSGWLSWWTIFYFGWYVGYAPITALFLARISRGRTVREIALGSMFICPLIMLTFYTLLGGSACAAELAAPGCVSGPMEASGYTAVLWATLQQLPLGLILSIVALFVVFAFVATTGQSMALTCAMTVTGTDSPGPLWKVFWGAVFGVTAGALLPIGGLHALQSFIIVSAIPVTFVVLFAIPCCYKSLKEDYRLTHLPVSQENADADETLDDHEETFDASVSM